MADGVLGLGQGQAASLNSELIEKLKTAESSSRVTPIELSITEIEVETLTIDAIKESFNTLLETIKPFDLFVSGGVNAFDTKFATTTGDAVTYEASDEANLDVGTTSITINSLATKDVFQSNTISDVSAILTTDNNIVIDGKVFSTDGEDFDDLATAMTTEGSFGTVTYDSGANSLSINGGATVISTIGSTYDTLATAITTDATYTSSTSYIEIDSEIFTTDGEDFAALATAIEASGTFTSVTYDSDANTLDIDGTVFSTYRADYNDLSATIDAEGTYSTNAKYIKINDDVISTLGKTHTEIAEDINTKTALNASLEEVATDTFRMVIKSVEPGLDNALVIEENGFNLGLNQYTSTATVTGGTSAALSTTTIDGVDFVVDGTIIDTYDDLISAIDAHADFEASIDGNGNVLIRREDGTSLDVTADPLSLGMLNNNHTQTSSNLSAIIDGIDYDVSSNEITISGGLNILAVETGTSSITVDNDTLALEPMLQSFVTQYNVLVSLVEEETLSSESSIQDKATLNTMMSSIKDKLFGSYGDASDKNIFNFGFELDKSGLLSLDSETFNTAVTDDLESLRTLFIGTAEDEGLGTQLKSFVDSLDGFDGLISVYEENMTARKEALTESKDKAIQLIDDKYAQLSAQFVSYSVIINQMEQAFGGLKMMIEQSTAG